MESMLFLLFHFSSNIFIPFSSLRLEPYPEILFYEMYYVKMIAYIDIITGISGDMFLAALIDAGYPADKLVKELKKLDIDFEMEIKKEEGTKRYSGYH